MTEHYQRSGIFTSSSLHDPAELGPRSLAIYSQYQPLICVLYCSLRQVSARGSLAVAADR